MKPSNTIVVSPKYIEEKERQIADLSKKIERLQKQLKEANDLLKSLTPLDRWQDDSNVNSYLKKWGVK